MKFHTRAVDNLRMALGSCFLVASNLDLSLQVPWVLIEFMHGGMRLRKMAGQLDVYLLFLFVARAN